MVEKLNGDFTEAEIGIIAAGMLSVILARLGGNMHMSVSEVGFFFGQVVAEACDEIPTHAA
jgi:hypothetical protein